MGFGGSTVDDLVDVAFELVGIRVVVEGKAVKDAVERDTRERAVGI